MKLEINNHILIYVITLLLIYYFNSTLIVLGRPHRLKVRQDIDGLLFAFPETRDRWAPV